MTIRHLSGNCEVEFASSAEQVRVAIEGAWTITDSNVSRAWPSLFGERTYVIPAGETSKSLGVYGSVLEWLAESKANRGSRIATVGGGVVGDLAGFVAAAYMRGVELVHVPTTLMAQVDSSIGGKVGINLSHAKNLVGAFYPASQVIVCNVLLTTLPQREFASGVAEIVKYGYISAPDLLDVLKEPLSSNNPGLSGLIRRCIEVKAKVVEEDEFERSGTRAALNFGHTIGHAIEQVAGYGTLLHGEAVSIGMVAEAKLGERIGLTPVGLHLGLAAVLQAQSLPTMLDPSWPGGALMRSMSQDKKSNESGVRWSLLAGIGECKLVGGIAEADVLAVLSER